MRLRSKKERRGTSVSGFRQISMLLATWSGDTIMQGIEKIETNWSQDGWDRCRLLKPSQGIYGRRNAYADLVNEAGNQS